MKLKGIVIKTTPYKDSDLMVTLLTKEGVVGFKAKGVRKLNSKNRPLVQLFSYIEAEFFRKGEKLYLINGKHIVSTRKFFATYTGLIFIQLVSELLERFALDEEKTKVFDDLEKAIVEVNEMPDDCDSQEIILKHLYHLILLITEECGYSPREYFKDTVLNTYVEKYLTLEGELPSLTKRERYKLLREFIIFIETAADMTLESVELV